MSGDEVQLRHVIEDRREDTISTCQSSSPKIAKPTRSFITGHSVLLQIPVNKLNRKKAKETHVSRREATQGVSDKHRICISEENKDFKDNQIIKKRNSEGFGKVKAKLSSEKEIVFPVFVYEKNMPVVDDEKKDLKAGRRKMQTSATTEDIENILNKESDSESGHKASTEGNSEDEPLEDIDSDADSFVKSAPETTENHKIHRTSETDETNRSEDSDSEPLMKSKFSRTTQKKKEDSDSDYDPVAKKSVNKSKTDKKWKDVSGSFNILDDEPEATESGKKSKSLVKKKGQSSRVKWRKRDDSDGCNPDSDYQDMSIKQSKELAEPGSSSSTDNESLAKKGKRLKKLSDSSVSRGTMSTDKRGKRLQRSNQNGSSTDDSDDKSVRMEDSSDSSKHDSADKMRKKISKSKAKGKAKPPQRKVKHDDSSDSDSTSLVKEQRNSPRVTQRKKIEESSDDDSDSEPLIKMKRESKTNVKKAEESGNSSDSNDKHISKNNKRSLKLTTKTNVKRKSQELANSSSHDEHFSNEKGSDSKVTTREDGLESPVEIDSKFWAGKRVKNSKKRSRDSHSSSESDSKPLPKKDRKANTSHKINKKEDSFVESDTDVLFNKKGKGHKTKSRKDTKRNSDAESDQELVSKSGNSSDSDSEPLTTSKLGDYQKDESSSAESDNDVLSGKMRKDCKIKNKKDTKKNSDGEADQATKSGKKSKSLAKKKGQSSRVKWRQKDDSDGCNPDSDYQDVSVKQSKELAEPGSSSNSDNESLAKKGKRMKKLNDSSVSRGKMSTDKRGIGLKRSNQNGSSTDDSDDESVRMEDSSDSSKEDSADKMRKKNSKPKVKGKAKPPQRKIKHDDSSDSDSEPLTNSKFGNNHKDDSSSAESDNEVLSGKMQKYCKTKNKKDTKKNSDGEADQKQESKSGYFSDSDSEPLSKIKSRGDKKSKNVEKQKKVVRGKQNIDKNGKLTDSNDSDLESENVEVKTKSSTRKKSDKGLLSSAVPMKSDSVQDKSNKGKSLDVRKQGKKSEMQQKGHNDDQLAQFKKYIRLIGVRVRSYDVLLEGCSTIKSKKEKLLQVLQENGMKGKPTIAKCKKLKDKLERKKELEELDLDNIIEDTGGRGRRNAHSLYATRTRFCPFDDDRFQSPIKPSKVKPISESDSEHGSASENNSDSKPGSNVAANSASDSDSE